ncbi:Mitochondrial import inner membrane translocase subunit TIM50 OS=Cryptococcus neoformans var, neoformans serotype D (strain JEC21 / ATCC MYA-565) GN=TIM50 PE=3 SV=1 [Rhizoctonia solani AG-1 IB]|uniref:Mitochondrial import inner membrane translocase subunit TIM50 n=1 Tax=Thanatephorus cucumeris (strain AG1-IB / isolate 7/3/14) TaxID=1108050 RepID=A0A0B7FQM4_THACB|nr:Mitochondrial import inner membrane translocase subunit TIM50 OS=Cryptococcus neoformans var, neoformans serotype D (strain JEC21 / ATCC MYA-565) GN=TIM50 PE=3 SV=1 [Rhizoctonia solani AG-1 IB]
MAVPRLVARTLIQRRLRYAVSIRQITTPPPPPPPNPTSTDEPLKPKSLPSLDISPIEATPPPNTPSGKPTGERTGARSAKDSLSTIEKKRQTFARWTIAFGLAGVIGGAVYMGREWESEEEKKAIGAGEELSLFGRSKARITDMFNYFNKPAWPELLPPPLPPPHQRPYTLVISLDDLLVTSTWDRQHGWRTAKRPGVDYFLGYLSQFYEIVLFTTQASYTAIPVVEKLDPFGAFILYKLFREATRTTKDGLVKDLNYLNRDLSKVIAIDTDKSKYSENPDNAIVIPKWRADGSNGDPSGLVGLIPFLESIAIHSPPDVRPILKAYQGKDIPKTYAAVEAEQKRKVVEEWEKKRKAGGSSGNMAIGGLFGFGGATKQHPADQPPLTYLEQRRKEYQDLYKQDQAYWAENSEKFRKMMEEDRERQMKEMSGSLLGWMGMAPPKDPGEQEKKA